MDARLLGVSEGEFEDGRLTKCRVALASRLFRRALREVTFKEVKCDG